MVNYESWSIICLCAHVDYSQLCPNPILLNTSKAEKYFDENKSELNLGIIIIFTKSKEHDPCLHQQPEILVSSISLPASSFTVASVNLKKLTITLNLNLNIPHSKSFRHSKHGSFVLEQSSCARSQMLKANPETYLLDTERRKCLARAPKPSSSNTYTQYTFLLKPTGCKLRVFSAQFQHPIQFPMLQYQV